MQMSKKKRKKKNTKTQMKQNPIIESVVYQNKHLCYGNLLCAAAWFI